MSVHLSDERKQSYEQPHFTVGVATSQHPRLQLLGCHCRVWVRGLPGKKYLVFQWVLCSCERREEPIRIFLLWYRSGTEWAGQWDAKFVIRFGNLLLCDILATSTLETGSQSKSKVLPWLPKKPGAKHHCLGGYNSDQESPQPSYLFWLPNILLR